jgi:hypothetical protein
LSAWDGSAVIPVEFTLQVAPDAAVGTRANRTLLRRVVRYLAAEVGITQFLDIGSGLPSQGNVHEIAHEINPAGQARPCRKWRDGDGVPGAGLAVLPAAMLRAAISVVGRNSRSPFRLI